MSPDAAVTFTSYGSPEPGILDFAITPVIFISLLTVTEEKATATPELFINVAEAPVKPDPLIIKV